MCIDREHHEIRIPFREERYKEQIKEVRVRIDGRAQRKKTYIVLTVRKMGLSPPASLLLSEACSSRLSCPDNLLMIDNNNEKFNKANS